MTVKTDNQGKGKGNAARNQGSNQDKGKGSNVMSSSDYAKARLANKRTIAASGAHPTIATIANAAIDGWSGKLTINAVFNQDELAAITALIESLVPGEHKKIDPMLFESRPSGISEETWKKYVKTYFNSMASGALPIRNGTYYLAIPIRINQYIWFVKTGDVVRALEYAGCFGTLSAKQADDIPASAAYAMRMSAARMAAPLAMDVYNAAHLVVKAHNRMIKAIDKHAAIVALRSAAIKESKAEHVTEAERMAIAGRVLTLTGDATKADGIKARAAMAYDEAERAWVAAWQASQGSNQGDDAGKALAAHVAPLVSNQGSDDSTVKNTDDAAIVA